MSETSRRPRTLGRFFHYANNIVSILGIILSTISALLIIVFIVADTAGAVHNPYTAVLAFVVLPAIFVLGLLLIPIGMLYHRHRMVVEGTLVGQLSTYPTLDFNRPDLRRTAAIVLFLTVVNGIILGSSSYLAVDEMDSVQFCGAVCHTVMQPEYTAYQQSPHSRVRCVECHIGPGAPWFVRSKLDGLRQVWHTLWNTFPRPIESPISNLRPARETCEQCHWPAKHYDDKLKLITRFATDEASTPSYTVLLLKTGGGSQDTGVHSGIHWWHIYADNRIRYVSADAKRQEMAWVEITTRDGHVRTYTKDGKQAPSAAEIAAKARVMDCIDCHNRPTHLFEVPTKALDTVLDRSPKLRTLPFYKREALATVTAKYATHDGGMKAVHDAVVAFYTSKYPDVAHDDAALVERGATEAAGVYGRSVFPAMNTDWRTHPNNIGHDDSPGCWRCHGGDMTSADGKEMIPADCDTCHELLVQDSPTRPDLEALMSGHK
jgi:nitrate/TMAO reductase-like tetraheme cytochrome c subunit